MVKYDESIERELIKLRAEGYGSKRIADELGVSKSTAVRWLKSLGLNGQLKEYKPSESQRERLDKECKECRGTFHPFNSYAEFCGDSCRSKYNKKHKGREQECKWCGKSFRNYKTQDHCSVECLNSRQKANRKPRSIRVQRFKKECKDCGSPFETLRKDKEFCSTYCKKRNEKTLHDKKCSECGRWYSTPRPKARYCSPECGRRYNNRRSEVARRERILENGPAHWDISIERLVKRDGRRCYLCGDNVRMDVDTNHKEYPSIEHVIPISKGGTHTWDNVKLAHRHCNTVKRDGEAIPPVIGRGLF